MNSKNKKKVLIFDWGGVIANSNNRIVAQILAKKYNLDQSVLLQFISQEENKYFDVVEDKNFFINISKKFLLDKDELRYELNRVGPLKQIMDLLFVLGKKYDLYLLSDQLSFKANNIRKKLVPSPFVEMFFSNELGISKYKSNDKIYDFVLNKIGIDADYYFIDNDKENVKFAKKSGINGILYTSYNELILSLKKCNVL